MAPSTLDPKCPVELIHISEFRIQVAELALLVSRKTDIPGRLRSSFVLEHKGHKIGSTRHGA